MLRGTPGCRALRRARLSRAALAALFFFLPTAVQAAVQAQEQQKNVLGHISGADISIEDQVGSGSRGASRVNTSDESVVVSGAVVTVHSGRARVDLSGGGTLGICGPAKMTFLGSGGAITLGLQFGRIHLQLSGETPFSLYSPLMLATPLPVAEGARDAVVGLDPNGRICARSNRGGIRLQQQLTGELFVVPQPRTLFFAEGDLQPQNNVAAECSCDIPPATNPTSPQTATAPPPSVPVAPAPKVALPIQPPAKTSLEVEFSVPARLNQSHPVAAAKQNPAPSPIAVDQPDWQAVMPPLTFTAGVPEPPDPAPDMILLIREAQIEPDWVFSGHVSAAKPQTSASHAASVPPPRLATTAPDPTQPASSKIPPAYTNANAAVPETPPTRPKSKSTGFFGKIRSFFRRLAGNS